MESGPSRAVGECALGRGLHRLPSSCSSSSSSSRSSPILQPSGPPLRWSPTTHTTNTTADTTTHTTTGDDWWTTTAGSAAAAAVVDTTTAAGLLPRGSSAHFPALASNNSLIFTIAATTTTTPAPPASAAAAAAATVTLTAQESHWPLPHPKTKQQHQRQHHQEEEEEGNDDDEEKEEEEDEEEDDYVDEATPRLHSAAKVSEEANAGVPSSSLPPSAIAATAGGRGGGGGADRSEASLHHHHRSRGRDGARRSDEATVLLESVRGEAFEERERQAVARCLDLGVERNVVEALSTAGVSAQRIVELIVSEDKQQREGIIRGTGLSKNYIMKLQRRALRTSAHLQLPEPLAHTFSSGLVLHVLFDSHDRALFIKKELCRLLNMKGTTFSYWKKKAGVADIDTSQDFRLMDKCRSIFGGRSTYTLYSAGQMLTILECMQRSRQKNCFTHVVELTTLVTAYHSHSSPPVELLPSTTNITQAEAGVGVVSSATPR